MKKILVLVLITLMTNWCFGFDITHQNIFGKLTTISSSPATVVIPTGSANAWNEHYREIGNVLYDPTDTGKEYKILVTAFRGTYADTMFTALSYAYSSDLTTWTLANKTIDLDTGCVGHWLCSDNADNATVDDGKNIQDGTLTTAGTATTSSHRITDAPAGIVNGLALASASTEYINIPYNAAYDVSALTISLWFRTSSAGNQILFGRDLYSYYININSGNIGFFLGNQSQADNYGTSFADGNWHFLVCTYDGTTKNMYVDSILRASPQAATIDLNHYTPDRPIRIGDSYDIHNYGNFSICDVRFYNKVLSQYERDLIYDETRGRTTRSFEHSLVPYALEDPYVVKDGSTYYLFAENKKQYLPEAISLWTSTDFSTWTRVGDITGLSVNSSSPVVWKENGTWYLVYESWSDDEGHLCIANTTDITNLAWTDYESNPFLEPMVWEAGVQVPDDIVKFGGIYYLIYHSTQNGIAQSTDLITWTRASQLGGSYIAVPYSDINTLMPVRRGGIWTFLYLRNNTTGVYKGYADCLSFTNRIDSEDWPPE